MKKINFSILLLIALMIPSLMEAKSRQEMIEDLQVAAIYANADCPVDQGDGVIMTSVTYTNNVFKYTYKMSYINPSVKNNDPTLKKALEKTLLELPETRYFLKELALVGGKLVFYYYVPNKNNYTLEYTNQELRNIIK